MKLWHFASSQGGGEGLEDTSLSVFFNFIISISVFCPTVMFTTGAQQSHFLRIPSETWVELHDNKRTGCFTRIISCDHRLNIRPRDNRASFRTNQFPATFVVAFGMNGFIQIPFFAIQCECRVRGCVRVRLRGRALYKKALKRP